MLSGSEAIVRTLRIVHRGTVGDVFVARKGSEKFLKVI